MAESKKGTQKTGVTHFPPEEEDNNQKRVPPRVKTKEQITTTLQTRKKLEAPMPPAMDEERTISRLGAKGGKSSGSRAGLVSSSKKTRRT